MKEVWKDVVGYEGLYIVSSFGRLATVRKRFAIMSDNSHNGNYYMINGLADKCKNARVKYRHRIVAEAFLPNPNNYPQVGHKDDNKQNNSVDNLYWCEGSRNIRDAHKTGRMKKRSEHGPMNQHSDYIVECAYRSVKMGYFGVSEAARFFGMPRTTLSSVMNKRARQRLTGPLDDELTNVVEIGIDNPLPSHYSTHTLKARN